MRTVSVLVFAGLVALSTLPAAAQSNPYRRGASQPAGSYDGYQTAPRYSPRATSPYSHPPGYRGTIYWNTPNADGNFGGPGAGGGSVGG